MIRQILAFFSSRGGAKLLIITGLISSFWLIYAYVPVAKVAAGSITVRDMKQFRSTTNELAAIAGIKDRLGWTQSLQSLVVTGIEREILAKNGVSINKENAVNLILSESPFRGILQQARKSMGEQRFYSLLIEPRAIGDTFQLYYGNKDSQRTVAANALEAAKFGGISAAEAKTGMKATPITLSLTQETAALFAAARQTVPGRVIPSVVEDGGGFSILNLREINQQSLAADAITVKRTPVGRFIIDEAKKAAVAISFPVYSPFSFSSLEKNGMIFSKQALGEESANEKK